MLFLRKIRYVLAIIVLGIFLWLVVMIYQNLIYTAKVSINAVPLESHITINGRAAKEGVNRVRPGRQKVSVSLNGFTNVNQTVTVKKGNSSTVDIVLVSNSSQTANWYLTHPADEKKAEGLSSQENDILAKQDLKNDPLIQYLPFVSGGLEFRVDYGTVPDSTSTLPAIYITAPSKQAQQDGVAWIQSLGYNPSHYTIEYVTGPVQPLTTN